MVYSPAQERQVTPHVRRMFALVSLAVAAMATPAQAIDPQRAITQYAIRTWYATDGLPQNSVHAILQTRDGYLWFGTEEGLARFDGVSFTVFNRASTPALGGNYVATLVEDVGGAIWAGARTGGGGVTRIQGGRSTIWDREQGLTQTVVTSMYHEPGGRLWIGTGPGVCRLKDGRLDSLSLGPGRTRAVSAMIGDGAGGVWVGTQGDGLFHLRDDRVEAAPLFPGAIVQKLLRDDRGRLWIGTAQGLFVIDGQELRRYGTEHGLPNASVHTLLEDRAGTLWVGTDGGLARLSPLDRFTALRESDGLSGNRIRSLFEDREGNLWVGTFAGGLSRLQDGKVLNYGVREGLPHDAVMPIFTDRDGVVWAGTMGEGLARIQDGKVSVLDRRSGLPDNTVESIAQGRDGAMWFGTFSSGLVRYKNGRFTTYGARQGLLHPQVMCVVEDPRGDIWAGTAGGGLFRLRKGRFTQFTTRDGLGHNYVRVLTLGRDSSLWIGTAGGGFSRYQNGTIRTWSRNEGLPRGGIGAILEDADGTVWINNYGAGLYRLRNNQLAAITSREGLADDAFTAIVDDGRGRLWMSSNNGIFYVARDELEAVADGRAKSVQCVLLDERDGMRSRECNGASPAATRTPDGRIWFPTLKGAVVVDPRRMVGNSVPPPVLVERVLRDRQSVEIADGMALPPGRGDLEIHYTALSFQAPDRVRFRYRLEGYDRDWIDAGTRRVAYYTNIPPGRYAFQVIACNNDGVWNRRGTSLTFRLRPHYWQTPVFWTFVAAALVALAIVIHRRRTRALKERASELADRVEERTRAQMELFEMNQQLEQAMANLRQAQDRLIGQERLRALGQMASGITHDLNNALMPILGYTDMLLKRPESLHDLGRVTSHLETIRLAAMDAGSIVNRLREFYRPREEGEQFPLVRLNPIVEKALELTQPKWKDQVLARGVTIEVRTELGQLPRVSGSEADLRELLTNLVFNAVDAMGEGGVLTIRTRLDGEFVVLEVIDTGAGMSEEVRSLCLEPFFTTKGERGTGLGLPMVYGIVQRHGGSIEIESTPGRGSTIRVRFPLPRADQVQHEAHAVVQTRPLKVLVVDDDAEVIGLVRDMLEGDGHTVESATDGIEGLQKLSGGAFDIVITDRAMPRMSGDQLAAGAKALRPELPVMMLTGFGELMAAQGERPEGVDLVIGKPITLETLRRAITTLLAEREPPARAA